MLASVVLAVVLQGPAQVPGPPSVSSRVVQLLRVTGGVLTAVGAAAFGASVVGAALTVGFSLAGFTQTRVTPGEDSLQFAQRQRRLVVFDALAVGSLMFAAAAGGLGLPLLAAGLGTLVSALLA